MNRYIAFLAVVVSLFVTSCSHTESVEPAIKGESLFKLNVVADDGFSYAGNTRADADHSLRLSANLFRYSDEGTTFVQHQEKKADGEITELTFNIPDKGKYIVVLFADYIPSSVSAVEGKFADRYYDTSDPLSVKAITGNGDFFNNENRDCFVGKCIFEKTINSAESSVVLRRPTSRVTIATEDRIEGIRSLTINSCSHIPSYRFNAEYNSTVGSVTVSEQMACETENVNVTPVSGNLFYFYTFAPSKSGNAGNGETQPEESLPGLGEIAFTITPTEGYKVQGEDSRCVIASGLINPVANYKITAKGRNWVVIDENSTHDAVIVNIESPEPWREKEQSI